MGTLSHTVFHPQNPDTAYALTNFQGVWKTVNGGASDWLECNNGLGSTARRITYGTVHPNSPNDMCILAAATGIFKSVDGGALWSAKNNGNPDSTRISCFERQPQDPNVLFAATSNGRIYRSNDNAENWTCLNLGNELPVNLRTIIIDPTNPNMMYAGANGQNQFWKSTDGGINWTLKNNGLTGFGGWIHGMTIDPTNPAVLYLNGYSGAIAKSTDRGESWFFAGTGIGQEINAIAVDYSNPNNLYAAGIGWVGGSGVWQSTDKGQTWARLTNGFPADRPYPSLNVMVMNPTDPNILYVGGRPMPAGFASIGVYKTVDGGVSWVAANNGLVNLEINALAIDPSNPNKIFAATAGGLFKTNNGGDQWDSTTLMNPLVRSLAIDPQNANIVYAGLFGAATVSKSTDGGETWSGTQIASDDSTVICIAIARSNSNIIYAGTIGDNAGVYAYKSTDAGQTWQKKSGGLPKLVDPDSWRWHRPKGLNTLAIDPINANVVYAGAALEGGIYRTTDGGESWSAMKNGYNGYPFTDILVIDPADRKTLYAGSYAGVWSYTASTTPEPAPDTNQAVVFPNPARGNSVTFAYYLDFNAEITLKVYSLSKELVTSVTEQKAAGDCSTILDITNIRPGVYFYQITTKNLTTEEIDHWKRQKLAIIR